MKKFSKILGLTAMSAIVLTSCVKNEESEGVKNLRDAQAELILAEAQKTLAEIGEITATVDGMKWQNMQAQYEYKQDSLSFEYQKAATDAQKADLARQQELAALSHQADMIYANNQLKNAEISALQVLAQLQNQKNSTLLGYVSKFNEVLGDIRTLQDQIASEEYYVTVNENDLSIESELRQIHYDSLNYNLTLKYQKARLVDENNNFNVYKASLTDLTVAKSELDKAQSELDVLNQEAVDQEVSVDKAYKNYQVLNEDWSLAIDALTKSKTIISILTGSGSGSYDGKTYKSIALYDIEINSLNSQIASANQSITIVNEQIAQTSNQLASWNTELTDLTSSLNTAEQVYKNALATFTTKQAEYNQAVNLYNQYNTTANQTAMNDAQAAMNTANTALTTAQTDYNKQLSLYNTALSNVNSAKSSLVTLNANITTLNANIANYTNQLADLNTNKTAASSELATLKSGLAALEASENSAMNKYYDALSSYNEIYSNYYAVYSKRNDTQSLVYYLENIVGNEASEINGENYYASQINDIQEDIDYYTELVNKTATRIQDAKAGKTQTEAEIAASKEYIVGLKSELESLKTELARYAELIKSAE